MTGLILKDLINLKKQARVYLILVLFYLVLGIANESSDMFSTMMIVVSAIIPITAMSYDERSKWDRYALTMPLSRKSMVASKYILGLIFLVASFILSMLFNSFFSNISLMENVMTCLATLSIGMVIMSVIFPLIFKFGVEKGRIFMMIVLFAPTALILLLSKLEISMPDEETIKSLLYLSPIVAAVIFIASIYISMSIYNKKEF
ncbi:MAG TPA: ABC-2 transporter permease [Clostridiales bacterium]|jgi:magnesium-transporting ATPase (P-type)|nr:ABC-2 transporter permease [Clostridiales bacterium]HCS10098.1 ABC-2 transporter permease [Clostridiales bacterium]